ncbi:MAG: MFS transporter [Dehalococcoidia bacterium]|nr:MFS transporter [Dehalococcoidia bacterium]
MRPESPQSPETPPSRPPFRPPSGRVKTFSSLQNHVNYRYLWTGNLFANCAQWLQFITIGWLALDISGSAFHSILTVAVRALPLLILGPWGGVLADRLDRRKLVMGVQVVMVSSALAFGILLANGKIDSIWHVYAYMLVSGIAFAFVQPTRQALVANVVPREDLGNALALNAMAVTSMRLAGAAISGVLIETVAFHWNFFVESALYVGMIVLLAPMKTPYRQDSERTKASPLADLKEGFQFIFGSREMVRLMVMNFVRTGVFMPLLLFLPAYTEEALGRGAGVSTAMIVIMGAGGLLATIMISSFGFFTKKGLVTLLTLISGSSVILILGLSQWVWVSVPIMLIMGLSQTHFIVANQTLIQTLVPDNLRGRVTSVWHYESGLIPLFAAITGGVGLLVGIGTAMAIGGVIALSISLIFLARFGNIRRLD